MHLLVSFANQVLRGVRDGGSIDRLLQLDPHSSPALPPLDALSHLDA